MRRDRAHIAMITGMMCNFRLTSVTESSRKKALNFQSKYALEWANVSLWRNFQPSDCMSMVSLTSSVARGQIRSRITSSLPSQIHTDNFIKFFLFFTHNSSSLSASLHRSRFLSLKNLLNYDTQQLVVSVYKYEEDIFTWFFTRFSSFCSWHHTVNVDSWSLIH